MIKPYLRYCFNNTKISKVNSSFIRRLNDSVFSKLGLVKDVDIQNYIHSLKADKTQLKVTDLGAGSKKTNSNVRTVSSIVKNASISPKFGRLLHLLIKEFNCRTTIEFGTSLGIGTSYLALDKSVKVLTIEGCPNISGFTQNKLQALTNVKFYVGEFSSKLNEVFSHSDVPDLVYIDGNHTYQATVDYFKYCLKNASPKAILVFDDIHWSNGMEKAWKEVIESRDVSVSIDLFRMGIVFLDQELEKENVIVSF